MLRCIVAGLLLLSSIAVSAESPREVRNHQAMEDSLTGARIGEATVIVRDQVYMGGSIDLLLSVNGVDAVFSHRTITVDVVTDQYTLRENGETLLIERTIIRPGDELRGSARVFFADAEIAHFAMPLDDESRASLRKVLDEKVSRAFQQQITRVTGWTPLEFAAWMMSAHPPGIGDLRISMRSIAPDCAFDERFGMPCSDAQKESVADEERSGAELTSY